MFSLRIQLGRFHPSSVYIIFVGFLCSTHWLINIYCDEPLYSMFHVLNLIKNDSLRKTNKTKKNRKANIQHGPVSHLPQTATRTSKSTAIPRLASARMSTWRNPTSPRPCLRGTCCTRSLGTTAAPRARPAIRSSRSISNSTPVSRIRGKWRWRSRWKDYQTSPTARWVEWGKPKHDLLLNCCASIILIIMNVLFLLLLLMKMLILVIK